MKDKKQKPIVIINIFSGNNFSLDGKSMVYIIVILTLIVSICSSNLPSELIDMFIRMLASY